MGFAGLQARRATELFTEPGGHNGAPGSGALIHNDELNRPCVMADSSSTIAAVSLEELFLKIEPC